MSTKTVIDRFIGHPRLSARVDNVQPPTEFPQMSASPADRVEVPSCPRSSHSFRHATSNTFPQHEAGPMHGRVFRVSKSGQNSSTLVRRKGDNQVTKVSASTPLVTGKRSSYCSRNDQTKQQTFLVCLPQHCSLWQPEPGQVHQTRNQGARVVGGSKRGRIDRFLRLPKHPQSAGGRTEQCKQLSSLVPTSWDEKTPSCSQRRTVGRPASSAQIGCTAVFAPGRSATGPNPSGAKHVAESEGTVGNCSRSGAGWRPGSQENGQRCHIIQSSQVMFVYGGHIAP